MSGNTTGDGSINGTTGVSVRSFPDGSTSSSGMVSFESNVHKHIIIYHRPGLGAPSEAQNGSKPPKESRKPEPAAANE